MRFLLRAALLAVFGAASYLAPEPTFGQTVEAAPPPAQDTGPSARTDDPAGPSEIRPAPVVPPPLRTLPQTNSAPATPGSECDHRAPGTGV
jgi:hypothetical protein